MHEQKRIQNHSEIIYISTSYYGYWNYILMIEYVIQGIQDDEVNKSILYGAQNIAEL